MEHNDSFVTKTPLCKGYFTHTRQVLWAFRYVNKTMCETFGKLERLPLLFQDEGERGARTPGRTRVLRGESLRPHSPAVKTAHVNALMKHPERPPRALKSDMKVEDQAKQIKDPIILESQFQLFL